MRYLITGINGFVGPHLARKLKEQGHEVTGISHTGVESEEFNILSCDIRDQVEIDELFQSYEFDGVFHLASRTHPPTSFNEPLSYFETNAMGAIYLTEAIKKFQPNITMMNCSTCEVYGIHPEGTKIDENTPLLASNPYSIAKLAADLYIHERCENGMLKAFTTRAFSHTGPGRPANYSISSDARQIAQILKGRKSRNIIDVGNLTSKRVVMDVRDVASIYADLMDRYIRTPRYLNYGEVWNIGGDELHDMQFYLDTMLGIFGVKAELRVSDKLYRKHDIPVQWPDSTKIRKLLGWNPQYTIEQTLTDLVNYWLERV